MVKEQPTDDDDVQAIHHQFITRSSHHRAPPPATWNLFYAPVRFSARLQWLAAHIRQLYVATPPMMVVGQPHYLIHSGALVFSGVSGVAACLDTRRRSRSQGPKSLDWGSTA